MHSCCKKLPWKRKGVVFVFFSSILLLGPALASAQQPGAASISINISANVLSTIEVVTLSDIYFGTVQPGQYEIHVVPTRDDGAGSMVARGRQNAGISISYDQVHILTRSEGTETLTFYYEVSGYHQDNQFASEPIEGFSREKHFNADGEFFLWVGGSVNIRNAVHGRYEGEFTIEIEYI